MQGVLGTRCIGYKVYWVHAGFFKYGGHIRARGVDGHLGESDVVM